MTCWFSSSRVFFLLKESYIVTATSTTTMSYVEKKDVYFKTYKIFKNIKTIFFLIIEKIFKKKFQKFAKQDLKINFLWQTKNKGSKKKIIKLSTRAAE